MGQLTSDYRPAPSTVPWVDPSPEEIQHTETYLSPETSTRHRRRTRADDDRPDYAQVLRLAKQLLDRMPHVAEDPSEFEALIERASWESRARSRWRDVVGRVYTASQIKRVFAVDDDQLDSRVGAGTMLRCVTSDGVDVFPAFQFDDAKLLRGLANVLEVFSEDIVDGWTLASWLRTPLRALGGRSLVDHLREGGDVDLAVDVASDQAESWSR